MTQQTVPIDPLLRWPEVQAIVKLSRSHAHALAAKGRFPKPIKICGSRSSGWLESEIRQYMAERVAESRPDHGEAP